MKDTAPRRLWELEQKFAELSTRVPDSPEKEALSVLHGIIQEMSRSSRTPAPSQGPAAVDIANLYRQAPGMDAPAVSTPLEAGTPAPDFALPDAAGRLVRLADFRGRRVVLVFYPLDWSPGCSQQLDLYEGESAELEKRDVQLLAVSADSLYSHGAWAAVRGLHFPLLADFHPKGEVARRYHVYRDRDGFSDRVVYVIDADGIIRGHQRAPYLHHIPDVAELLTLVDGADVARSAAEMRR
jgi:peroxiredoxin